MSLAVTYGDNSSIDTYLEVWYEITFEFVKDDFLKQVVLLARQYSLSANFIFQVVCSDIG